MLKFATFAETGASILNKFKRRPAWQVNAVNVSNELITLSKRSDTQAAFLAQHKDSQSNLSDGQHSFIKNGGGQSFSKSK